MFLRERERERDVAKPPKKSIRNGQGGIYLVLKVNICVYFLVLKFEGAFQI